MYHGNTATTFVNSVWILRSERRDSFFAIPKGQRQKNGSQLIVWPTQRSRCVRVRCDPSSLVLRPLRMWIGKNRESPRGDRRRFARHHIKARTPSADHRIAPVGFTG